MKKALFLFLVLLAPSTSAHSPEQCQAPVESLALEIQALYPSPGDGEEEWVELYNPNDVAIDLNFYTLEDANENPWTLNGNIAAESGYRITDLAFQLNNGGDTVTLRSLDGSIIDQMIYESSQEGQIITRDNNPSIELTEESIEIPAEWPEFSEALPNPEGSDTTNEWIELYNPYPYSLPLDGFLLDDQEGGSSPHAITGNISANEYWVISIEESGITLNNSTDSIRLLDQEENLLWEVTYEDSEEAQSYAKIEDHYEWTSVLTPGEANQSSGEDNINGDLSEDIEITEVFPNPDGADQNEEWIEITNGGEETVNLGNWTIDDGPEGSQAYTFPDDTMIAPGESILLYRTESKLALNNSNESIVLTDFMGESMDELHYEESREGMAYAKINIEELQNTQASSSGLGKRIFSTWQWVSPSPGVKNPSWKQIEGEVITFDGRTLTLFDGISNWQLQSIEGQFDEILFQPGNTIQVSISDENNLYTIQESKLIKQAEPASKNQFPWGVTLSLIALTSWFMHEGYNKWIKQDQVPAQLQTN